MRKNSSREEKDGGAKGKGKESIAQRRSDWPSLYWLFQRADLARKVE